MIGTLDKSFFNENNLVNLGNSILKAYGLKTFHPSIKKIDDALKGHKKICLFLFDGMGEYIQQVHSKSCKFIRSGKFTEIYSTNPATTVAATNAIRSAKYPLETGWIGWIEYMPSIDKTIRCFANNDVLTNEPVSEKPLLSEYGFYKPVSRLLREKGIKASEFLGKVENDALEDPTCPALKGKSLRKERKIATKFFKDGGEYLYSYWSYPDHTIHDYGVNSRQVKEKIRRIDRMVKKFTKKNKDVLTIVIADHGLIDVKYDYIAKDKKLYSCIKENHPLTIEGRTPSFFVKEGKEKEFEKAFKNHFKNSAVLMTKQEALDLGYFGKVKGKAKASEFFGNYVGVITNSNIVVSDSLEPEHEHKAHHAGGSKEERVISLSIFNK